MKYRFKKKIKGNEKLNDKTIKYILLEKGEYNKKMEKFRSAAERPNQQGFRLQLISYKMIHRESQ
jgi:hypothetical protein